MFRTRIRPDSPRERLVNISLIICCIFFAIALTLFSGCATQNLDTQIARGYVTVESIAKTVADECGNVSPASPCRSTSLVTTTDASRIKLRLREAKQLLDAASIAYIRDDPTATASNLESSRLVIAAVKGLLIERGIE